MENKITVKHRHWTFVCTFNSVEHNDEGNAKIFYEYESWYNENKQYEKRNRDVEYKKTELYCPACGKMSVWVIPGTSCYDCIAREEHLCIDCGNEFAYGHEETGKVAYRILGREVLRDLNK